MEVLYYFSTKGAPQVNLEISQPRTKKAAKEQTDSLNANIPVRYYTNELTDDFSDITRNTFKVGGKYRYLHKNLVWRFFAFIVYRIIMTPFAFLWCKIKFRYKTVNRKAYRAVGKNGCFTYANHTLMAGDAFFPSVMSFPKRTDVVVSPDNLAVPITRGFIEMSGAIPVPNEFSGTRNFLNALEKKTLIGRNVQIYPEAHVWPYYTGIRPFTSASFRYPVRFDVPVFASTTTYQKNGNRKTPRVTVFLDGPFYPDRNLPPKEREQDLRDRVYGAMCSHTKENTVEPIRYVKRESAGPES